MTDETERPRDVAMVHLVAQDIFNESQTQSLNLDTEPTIELEQNIRHGIDETLHRC